jgi:Relaxase/Mobilisation nuclease domain
MKSPAKSRFGKLVAYLLDPQDKKTRVGEVVITNCVSTDTTWAVREIAATQWLNTRAKSARTYHLIISLGAGENADAQSSHHRRSRNLPCPRQARRRAGKENPRLTQLGESFSRDLPRFISTSDCKARAAMS